MRSNSFPYSFIAAEHDRRQSRIVHIARDGSVQKEFTCSDLPLDFDLNSEGNLLLTMQNLLLEVSPDWKTVLWEKDFGDVLVSSCQYLTDTEILVAHTRSCRIMSLSTDSLDIGKQLHVSPVPDLEPAYNLFRTVRQLASGTILVNQYHERKVVEYDWKRDRIWQCPVDGGPYMSIRLDNGHTMTSCGQTGIVMEVDEAGQTVWRYDMTEDSGLDRGWIAGIQWIGADGVLTLSDSRHDRMIALEKDRKRVVGMYDNPNELIHPASHRILL